MTIDLNSLALIIAGLRNDGSIDDREWDDLLAMIRLARADVAVRAVQDIHHTAIGFRAKQDAAYDEQSAALAPFLPEAK